MPKFMYRASFISFEENHIWKLQFNPFNSHEWPSQNFSLQYLHNINQISDETKEKYQIGET